MRGEVGTSTAAIVLRGIGLAAAMLAPGCYLSHERETAGVEPRSDACAVDEPVLIPTDYALIGDPGCASVELVGGGDVTCGELDVNRFRVERVLEGETVLHVTVIAVAPGAVTAGWMLFDSETCGCTPGGGSGVRDEPILVGHEFTQYMGRGRPRVLELGVYDPHVTYRAEACTYGRRP